MSNFEARSTAIDLSDTRLYGDLYSPEGAKGLVVFVHGSGSSRHSPRNRFVATALQELGFATLLFDLLSREEDQSYENRFDIMRLTRRLLEATEWLTLQEAVSLLPLGYFGASTGAAAALNAAAELGSRIRAVVSRGGRPDLAFPRLSEVRAPTLFIVGGRDPDVLALNQRAFAEIRAVKKLVIVPGATHLFEEPGTLEQVAELAGNWLTQHCRAESPPAADR